MMVQIDNRMAWMVLADFDILSIFVLILYVNKITKYLN